MTRRSAAESAVAFAQLEQRALIDMSRIAISRADAGRMASRGDRDRELAHAIKRRLQLRKQQERTR